MKLGAEPRKIAILAVLVPVAGYLVYSNLFSSSSAPPPPRAASTPKSLPDLAPVPAPPSAIPGGGVRTPPPQAVRARRAGLASVQEWTPRLGSRRPEERPDPTKVDPTLRLDLLARLQSITLRGGERSLFDFSAAPPPKVEEPKILPVKSASRVIGPQPEPPAAPEAKPAEAPKPPLPPIPLKFYGFVGSRDGKRAFFLEGEEIFVAVEGELVRSRYKVIRIGLNSAVLEDTQHEGHQQSIPLEEVPAGS